MLAIRACRERLAQHHRDDLGVGGDLGRNLKPSLRDQVGVVVYVTVEHSGDVRDIAAIRIRDARDIAAIRIRDVRDIAAIRIRDARDIAA